MKVTRNGIDTFRGPADWFTGTVFIDAVADAGPLGAIAVHFTPGARTAWPPARPDDLRDRGDRALRARRWFDRGHPPREGRRTSVATSGCSYETAGGRLRPPSAS